MGPILPIMKVFQFTKINLLKTIIFALLVPGVAYGSSSSLDEWTLGMGLIKEEDKSGAFIQADLGILDAEVVTSPPDQKLLSRGIYGLVNYSGRYLLSNGSLKISGKQFFTMMKSENEVGPSITNEQTITKSSFAFDYNFKTSRGLDIGLGLEYLIFPGYEQKISSDLIVQDKSHGDSSVMRARLSILRQGSGWIAGAYYVSAGESERDIETSAGGITDNSNEIVGEGPELGVMANISVSSIPVYGDVAYIKASEVSTKSSDGTVIKGDYLRFIVGADFTLQTGVLSTIITHQTLGYGANAFATIDTIPFSSIKAKYTQSIGSFKYEFGGFFGYGNDGLSIPEANETYNVKRFGLTTGASFSL